MTRKRIGIEGMSCGHCVNHVKEALTEDIQGVKVIAVSYTHILFMDGFSSAYRIYKN